MFSFVIKGSSYCCVGRSDVLLHLLFSISFFLQLLFIWFTKSVCRLLNLMRKAHLVELKVKVRQMRNCRQLCLNYWKLTYIPQTEMRQTFSTRQSTKMFLALWLVHFFAILHWAFTILFFSRTRLCEVSLCEKRFKVSQTYRLGCKFY